MCIYQPVCDTTKKPADKVNASAGSPPQDFSGAGTPLSLSVNCRKPRKTSVVIQPIGQQIKSMQARDHPPGFLGCWDTTQFIGKLQKTQKSNHHVIPRQVNEVQATRVSRLNDSDHPGVLGCWDTAKG